MSPAAAAAPRAPRLPAASRVLVREVNWLGDLVMTMPALRAVRRALPHARLSVLVRRELAGMFDGARWIDEVIPFHLGRGLAGLGDRRRLVATLRARRFELAVVLPRSFESALWPALARIPRRIGYRDDARRLLLTEAPARTADMLRRHQVHDFLTLIGQTLGIAGDPADCGLDIDPGHRARVDAWLAARRRRRGPLVALAVSAAYGPAKQWPSERWVALADRLFERHDAECVLVGAPDERARCAQIAAATRQGALVAAGETGIGELLALLTRCAAFAGNDSGAMHVAGALGLPTVGLFGSTNPLRTAPLGPRTRVIHHRLPCSPCLARTCRFGHYDCLRRIEVHEVDEALCALGAFGAGR